jgi:short chain dehydrogenase
VLALRIWRGYPKTAHRADSGRRTIGNRFFFFKLITDTVGKKFWELDPLAWDEVNNVGLRNHYICSVYAARMMVQRKKGLIVTVSSFGGLKYLFNVAYGVGKSAVSLLCPCLLRTVFLFVKDAQRSDMTAGVTMILYGRGSSMFSAHICQRGLCASGFHANLQGQGPDKTAGPTLIL